MHQWLALFDPGSILELDYGALCGMLSWDEMDDDHSARDIHDALRALDKEFPRSADLYQSVLVRLPSCAHESLNWPPRGWPGADSNCRHRGFQPRALPTELPGPSR